ncbi:MAG: hypothetical protein ACOCXG_02325 [Nanoarchaeota archaeon]
MAKTVKKKGAEKKVEKVVPEVEMPKKSKDDEPSWYHYVIVLLVLAGVIFGVYYLGNLFFEEETGPGTTMETYPYVYTVGNVNYNIIFNSPVEVLNSSDLFVPIEKSELFQTQRFVFSYTPEANVARVGQASIKLKRFLGSVFSFQFTPESFKTTDEINCSNSTLKQRVILFDVGSQENSIEVEDNGCIIFNSVDENSTMFLVDKFIWEIVSE